MTVIWKWSLNPQLRSVLQVPKGTKLLGANNDPSTGMPSVWGIVPDREAKTEDRVVFVIGTGHPVPDNVGRFLGTVIMPDAHLAWHVFDGGGVK